MFWLSNETLINHKKTCRVIFSLLTENQPETFATEAQEDGILWPNYWRKKVRRKHSEARLIAYFWSYSIQLFGFPWSEFKLNQLSKTKECSISVGLDWKVRFGSFGGRRFLSSISHCSVVGMRFDSCKGHIMWFIRTRDSNHLASPRAVHQQNISLLWDKCDYLKQLRIKKSTNGAQAGQWDGCVPRCMDQRSCSGQEQKSITK